MELVPVESSHIVSIGFEGGIMRVQFKDGRTFDYPATAEQHAAMMSAPSKGSFLHRHFKASTIAIAGDTSGDTAMSSDARSRNQTHEPDDCCGKRISKALRDGTLDVSESWECPKCGLCWKPTIVEGLRHWAPHCPVMRF